MTTPSARIWARLEDDDDTRGVRERLAAEPRRRETLVTAADRVAAGVPLRDGCEVEFFVRAVLDEEPGS